LNFLPFGTVYGTLLNFRREVDAWQDRAQQPPYKAAPQAPVLYVKTANTWTTHGQPIAVPASVPQVEIGATAGLVMGAANTVAQVVLMNDLSVPHASFFRPPVKFKCLDGFLGIGAQAMPLASVADLAALRLTVKVNGAVGQEVDFAQLVRSPSQLVADVSAFMTLRAGDVLMVGCDVLPSGARPLAAVGDRIDIDAPGFPTLSHWLVKEAA
jgi:5-oxopent-3-ene-1,2,5-tricarboxylate decarboxylase/2-hydroxyhepta-2,4-diene-1,7-dioate isomerase